MANSSTVSSIKDKVIDAIIEDDALVAAIDATGIEDPVDLAGTHIFRYNKNPNLITESITFITIMVHINSRDRNGTFVTPTLEIWIYSENSHMDLRPGEIPGIHDNRNDYISKLLDVKINGSSEYGGVGTFKVVSNVEGTYNEKFLYRRLIFETIDVNNSFCRG